jgi:hypothetical protein
MTVANNDYILPSTNKINTITSSKPIPPLGPYPQLLLWGPSGNHTHQRQKQYHQ